MWIQPFQARFPVSVSRGFGPRSKICRPDTEASHRTRGKNSGSLSIISARVSINLQTHRLENTKIVYVVRQLCVTYLKLSDFLKFLWVFCRQVSQYGNILSYIRQAKVIEFMIIKCWRFSLVESHLPFGRVLYLFSEMPECYACSSWFSLPAQGVFFTLDPILRGKKTNLTITLTSEES